LENAHIIFIGKDTFQKFIQEKFIKIESDTKENLINILNKYLTLPQVKIERFVLSESKMLFFKTNEIIYNEGDENKHLYIIYRGEANLIKNIKQGEKLSIINSLEDINIEKIQKKAKNLDYKEILKKPLKRGNSQNPLELELLLNKNNYQVVASLGKGSMGGLEIVTGVTNFKYSLISNSSFTSVYKINLKALDEHLKEFMVNLLPLFIELEDKIHTQIDSIKYIDCNIIPFNCQK
jgi:CRP-like cAMP-binding protein